MPNFIDLTGMRFGRLLVLERAPNKIQPSGAKKTMWHCVCDCGRHKDIWSNSLIKGNTTSCGCLQKESVTHRNTTHGMSKSRLNRIFGAMQTRCYNPHFFEYPQYGGRGITICKEWREDKSTFFEWALKNGYSDTLSIDRIDVNDNYCPDNCRWVSPIVQANNKTTNKVIEYKGNTMTLSEWSRTLGITYQTLKDRLGRYGWSIEKAFTTPTNRKTYSK